MRIVRLLLPVALVGAVVLVGAVPIAGAQPGPPRHSPTIWSAGNHTIRHTTLRSQGFPDAATHYLYIDTGNCPNSLDVYQVTGKTVTFLQNFAVPNACETFTYSGGNTLGYSAPCLVLADYGGNIFSFSVDQSTHEISAQVSKIPDPFGLQPTDVKISGSTAIVTTSGYPSSGGVESYAIAANCALSPISTVSEPAYLLSSAVVAGKGVVSPDENSSAIYAFKLAANGTLTYANTTQGQFANPDSVATSGTAVETGQATYNATQVQAGTIEASGAITWGPTSPQTDPNGLNGTVSWYDPVFKHWVVAELDTESIGFFSKTPFAYSSTILTPDGGHVGVFQQIGPNLTWLDGGTETVDVCTVTASGCGAPQVAIVPIQNGASLGGYVLI